MADLRDQGQMGGGQAPYAERDRQAFANALDRLLTRLQREADLRASQPHR
ncbi:YaiI/YqxD family protein [Pseudomonas aeruginosa]|nr:YaiI/YqxD family protein [Pseudomonas aeruginosa]